MLNMECPKPTKPAKKAPPIFGRATSIPAGYADQLSDAVKDFIAASGLAKGVDREGFYYQTLQAIANSAIIGQGRELWLGAKDGELYTYILASIGPDFDGRLAYTVAQAWVREDQRGQPWVREAWETVRRRAKDTLCSHFAVYSTKENTKAYCRFLGKGFHKVSEILKQEL